MKTASIAPVDWAHPRSRGENTDERNDCKCKSGSSPLTRGKRVERGAHLVDVRLIPAHAGKTGTGYSEWHTPEAHPRSRGENWGEFP